MATNHVSVKDQRVIITSGVHKGKVGWHVWDVKTPTGTKHVVKLDGGFRVRVNTVENA